LRRHIIYPLTGDNAHEEGTHNGSCKETSGEERLSLHARSLEFSHPVTGKELRTEVPLDSQWPSLLEQLTWRETFLR
jgi:tRNA pseudouridine65 synthase